MNYVYFTHSLKSCWNHGNAHFVRGVAGALIEAGHAVKVYEPRDAWSLRNLVADQGPHALDVLAAVYPHLAPHDYDPADDIAALVEGADVVIVHEWNEPELVATLGALRARGARFTLLFHDTHHRAVSEPAAMARYALEGYDGVLAFGAALAQIYRTRGWGARVFVWHEAADPHVFAPPREPLARAGLCWIGNWGDGERTAELEMFLFAPAARVGAALDVYGVRYPDEARAMLVRYGARYHGWLANARAPAVFAAHRAAVHVPRRYYAEALPGIPTIRVFETLACGIPLVSAPWSDCEGLFRDGDFLVARDGAHMEAHLRMLMHEPQACAALAARGLDTILARHTCAHRVAELDAIVAAIRQPAGEEAFA